TPRRRPSWGARPSSDPHSHPITPQQRNEHMRKSPLAALAAIATATTLALTGCVPGENAGPDGGDGGEWSSSTLSLDYATYNPLSLIIREQGWIEATLG